MTPSGESVCQTCGYRTVTPGKYHPYVFCVLMKAGQDPWDRARDLVRDLQGFEEGAHPPSIAAVQAARR